MPDRRRHRGPHPKDHEWFAREREPALRAAAHELSWLLSRGYRLESALELVGNRHALTARQRTAVARGTCTAAQKERRRRLALRHEELHGKALAIDGFNCLIGVESALSGGVLLVGLDGAHRDLSSVHGTYRRVSETARALESILDVLTAARPSSITWVLDRPVSNSGRVKALVERSFEARAVAGTVELAHDADRVVVEPRFEAAVSCDGWVLDHAPAWFDVVGHLARQLHEAFRIDLSDETSVPDASSRSGDGGRPLKPAEPSPPSDGWG